MTIDPLLAAKITYVLGITNLIFLFLVLLTCRCILGKFSVTLSKSKTYAAINKYHCLYWWFFIASVLIHGIFAIVGFGNPF